MKWDRIVKLICENAHHYEKRGELLRIAILIGSIRVHQMRRGKA